MPLGDATMPFEQTESEHYLHATLVRFREQPFGRPYNCSDLRDELQFHLQERSDELTTNRLDRWLNWAYWHLSQPKVYRQGQETPDELCPPGGEAIRDAKERVVKAIRKIVRKSGDAVVAFVVPDPMAAVVASVLSGNEIPDLWKAETDCGSWQLIESVVG